MRKEYGGYLPLELRNSGELFDQYTNARVACFNCGRSAITAAVLSISPKRLYIPYYNCSVVQEALAAYGVEYKQYFLNNKLEPEIDSLGPDDWLVYVNYFGIISDYTIQEMAKKYKNVLFDNTQALFAKPILDGNCMNAYSPRKFVGLVDGAYLVWSGDRSVSEDYPIDISWDRAAFLFKSIELGTNAAYQENLDSKVCLAGGIKRMSVLTRRMLRSVDYKYIEKQRNKNFRVLRNRFDEINELGLSMNGNAPFVYPLLIEKDELRKSLVEKRIYVSQWWKYLLTEVPDNSVEARLSKWLLPLPIDQRYSEQDMEEMSELIMASIGEK